MMWHVTARAVGRLKPLETFAAAAVMWDLLRRAFPLALAAVVMPDHFHLIVALVAAAATALRQHVGALLSGLTRSGVGGLSGLSRGGLGGPRRTLWEPVPPPVPVPDVHHLRRQVRYLALNPCRAHLCRDPLSWIFSTHRDVVGAVVDPWVTATRLAAALGASPDGFAAAHHAYVAADPTVQVAGTPPPRAAPGRESPVVPLEAVAAAAAAALRLPPDAVGTRAAGRRLFVHLARHQGWRESGVLAKRCRVLPRQIRRLWGQPAQGLDAARLCLGDRRLVAEFMSQSTDEH